MIAVGFAVHTGWVAAVVVDGDARGARVIDRRRVSLSDAGDERFVYHVAASLPAADAAPFVARARDEAHTCAAREIGSLVAEHQPSLAALGPAGKPLPSTLDAIRRSTRACTPPRAPCIARR